MSFYDKSTVKNYVGLLETYMEYCWLALGNSQPVVIDVDYGRSTYIRTPEMLFKEIIVELNTNYNSPDKAADYRLSRRRMFK